MSGMGGMMMSGMALGAGSEVGHMAVRSMMGGGSSHGGQSEAPQQQQQQQMQEPMGQQQQMAAPQQQYNPCMSFNSSLIECIKQNGSDIGMCQGIMNSLNQCEKDAMSSNM